MAKEKSRINMKFLFKFTCCRSSEFLSHADLMGLAKGGGLSCRNCGTPALLEERDRREIGERLRRDERNVTYIVVFGAVYIVLGIVLGVPLGFKFMAVYYLAGALALTSLADRVSTRPYEIVLDPTTE